MIVAESMVCCLVVGFISQSSLSMALACGIAYMFCAASVSLYFALKLVFLLRWGFGKTFGGIMYLAGFYLLDICWLPLHVESSVADISFISGERFQHVKLIKPLQDLVLDAMNASFSLLCYHGKLRCRHPHSLQAEER